MPTVDSKTVARMASIFETHEGRPFDVRRIRPGGYLSIDDAIQDLVFGNDGLFQVDGTHPREVES